MSSNTVHAFIKEKERKKKKKKKERNERKPKMTKMVFELNGKQNSDISSPL